MLYVYFGSDTTGVRQKAFHFVHTLTRGDALATNITEENYQIGIIENLAEGVSLFNAEQVTVLDTPSENEDFFEGVLSRLELMQESLNHFVVIEGTLNAGNKKRMHAHATKMEEVEGEKKEKFNTFLLTDALLRRDKKSLWLLLMDAWKAGITNEAIIGVLFWQVKVLRLAEKTKSAEEAEQNSFVYQKAKRALSNFKKGELDDMSRALLTMYHDGHLGKHDASIALEKWVLGV